MEEVTTTNVFSVGAGLLVELVGIDDRGEIVVETIEFDLPEADDQTVEPREEIPSDQKERVQTALAENGYSLPGS